MSQTPIRVGIAGLGRSGWNMHAHTLATLPEHYQVVAAMDFSPERRNDAAVKFGAKTYDSYEALLADESVELVVVATPNSAHKSNVVAALQAGKHALCEKPFGTTSAEADEMIAAALQSGKIVAPFQNRRYEAHFQKVRELVESGILGEIHLIRIGMHNFNRRWDWQTLKEFSGGYLNNWGPHIIDQALQLMHLEDDAPDPEMWVDLQNVLSSGDAEDHIKMVLRAPNSPTIDIELSSAVAFGQDRWNIAGKNGGLRGSSTKLEWKWVDWSQMPERPIDREPTVGRSYNSETLEWQHGSWSAGENTDADLMHDFYRELFDTVRNGKPLTVTPQSVRRQISLIEKAKEMTGFA
ncbi:MAG TPA: Gfo/Idh/MocA family oxidoreductase [Abditibacterium sp.]|jgi:predicted dehydrogenase